MKASESHPKSKPINIVITKNDKKAIKIETKEAPKQKTLTIQLKPKDNQSSPTQINVTTKSKQNIRPPPADPTKQKNQFVDKSTKTSNHHYNHNDDDYYQDQFDDFYDDMNGDFDDDFYQDQFDDFDDDMYCDIDEPDWEYD